MKRTLALLLVLSLLISLCGCGHEHSWSDATCTAAKTCSGCGETEGNPLGHDWTDATCTEAKTCKRCGATDGDPLGHDWTDATCTEAKTCKRCGAVDGDPLGHDWADATCTEAKTCKRCGVMDGKPLGHTIDNWETIKEASCTEKGLRKGICSICGEAEEQEIPMAEHTPSEWTITVPATWNEEGTRTKICEVCGKQLKTEKYSLSVEEIEKDFKAKCEIFSYDDLQRNPGKTKDQLIKLSGSVFQIISEAESDQYYSTYFIESSGNLYLVYIDNYGSDSRILEDDYITVWGIVGDLYSYETIWGSGNIVPSIYAMFYS